MAKYIIYIVLFLVPGISAAFAQISGIDSFQAPEEACGDIGKIGVAQPRNGLVLISRPAGEPVREIELRGDRQFTVRFFLRNCLGRDLTSGYHLEFFGWDNALENLSIPPAPLGNETIERSLVESDDLGSFPINTKVRFSNILFIGAGEVDATGMVQLTFPESSPFSTYTIIGCPTRVDGLNANHSFSSGAGTSLVCGQLAMVALRPADTVAGDDFQSGTTQLDWAVTGVQLTKANVGTLEFARERNVLVQIENVGPTELAPDLNYTAFVSVRLIDRRSSRNIENLARKTIPRNKISKPGDKFTLSVPVQIPGSFLTLDRYRQQNGQVRRRGIKVQVRLLSDQEERDYTNNVGFQNGVLRFAKGCEIALSWQIDNPDEIRRVTQQFGRIALDYINLGDRRCRPFRIRLVRRKLENSIWGAWETVRSLIGVPEIKLVRSLNRGGFVRVNMSDNRPFLLAGGYQYSVGVIGNNHPDINVDNHQGDKVAFSFLVFPSQ